jgi:hypothetical protein
MNTKEILLAVLVAMFSSQLTYCQDIVPLWISDAWRSKYYPSSEWYTGFSQDVLKQKANTAESLNRLEKEAQNKMAENIAFSISGISTVANSGDKKQQAQNYSEKTSVEYRQIILSSTDAKVTGMETRSYHDTETSRIYAFAAVKKKDMANFYKARISSIFSFANNEFAIAEYFTEQGKKKQALDKIHAAEDTLKSISHWGSLLQSIENDSSYLEKEISFWQRVNIAKTQLQNGTSVYLDISGDNDLGGLGAEIQEKGCNCTIAEERGNAEYLVTIKTKLSRCDENKYRQIFCYVNAIVIINSTKLKKTVNLKVDEEKGGWTNGNKDKATEEAFKKFISSLAEKINQTINQ